MAGARRRPISPVEGGPTSSPIRVNPALRGNINVVNRAYVPRRRTGWRRWNDITWTAGTTNPVLNNGTLKAWYRFTDRWFDVYVELVMGSTTTYGSGLWIFSTLPAVPMTTRAPALATYYDSSGGASYAGWCQVRDSGELRPTTPSIATSGAHTSVSATAPFTWAQDDELVIEGRYRYTN